MKIKLSKSQWELVGKKAGWIKKGQSAFTNLPGEHDDTALPEITYLPKSWVSWISAKEGQEPYLCISDGGQTFLFENPSVVWDMVDSLHESNPGLFSSQYEIDAKDQDTFDAEQDAQIP